MAPHPCQTESVTARAVLKSIGVGVFESLTPYPARPNAKPDIPGAKEIPPWGATVAACRRHDQRAG